MLSVCIECVFNIERFFVVTHRVSMKKRSKKNRKESKVNKTQYFTNFKKKNSHAIFFQD